MGILIHRRGNFHIEKGSIIYTGPARKDSLYLEKGPSIYTDPALEMWLTFLISTYVTTGNAFAHADDRSSDSYKNIHDDVIKWKHFPRHWPFVRGIHRSPVNSPHKGQWRRTLMSYLICALNKPLSKWFETPSRSLWRHCNFIGMFGFRFIQMWT